jgi:hypothetical protein
MDILKERHQNPASCWSALVSFDEFITGFLHWSEKTSTSSSGRHLGMYGALVTAYCNSSGEFSDYSPELDHTTKGMAEQIMLMIHRLAYSAAKHGFYLQRWIKVVKVMTYKNRGASSWTDYA